MKSICIPECRRNRLGTGIPALPALALALVPKCPVCLGAYFGFFAILGISTRAVQWSLVVVLGSLGALALSAMFCSGRRLGRMTPFFLGSGGLLALLTSRVVALPATVGWTGVSLFCLACILAGYSTKTKTVD